MKFSKPGETDGETGETGDTTEMPVVETMLTERLSLDPKPVDEMVETNGNVLGDVFGRLGELESRVEELEDRNNELEQQSEELAGMLERTWELLEQANSVEQIRPGDRDP